MFPPPCPRQSEQLLHGRLSVLGYDSIYKKTWQFGSRSSLDVDIIRKKRKLGEKENRRLLKNRNVLSGDVLQQSRVMLCLHQTDRMRILLIVGWVHKRGNNNVCPVHTVRTSRSVYTRTGCQLWRVQGDADKRITFSPVVKGTVECLSACQVPVMTLNQSYH